MTRIARPSRKRLRAIFSSRPPWSHASTTSFEADVGRLIGQVRAESSRMPAAWEALDLWWPAPRLAAQRDPAGGSRARKSAADAARAKAPLGDKVAAVRRPFIAGNWKMNAGG